jgi:hypothetical protein
MEDVGIFYGQLVYIVAIWYILWIFGLFFPVLVCCIKKNLATLQVMMKTYKNILSFLSSTMYKHYNVGIHIKFQKCFITMEKDLKVKPFCGIRTHELLRGEIINRRISGSFSKLAIFFQNVTP